MGTKFAIILAMTIMSFCGFCEDLPLNVEENKKEEINENVVVLDERNEIDIPILMYHHITPDASTVINTMTITPECFENHMVNMLDMGYTPVFLEELITYVESGEKLPEKPICITFDDGYLSNYEYAFPILKKYNIKANIAVIGTSIGKHEYKDTDYAIIPHFTIEQAQEMEDSRTSINHKSYIRYASSF